MGPEGACKVIFKKEISKAKDPKKEAKRFTDGYRKKFANPYLAASRGHVDDVVDPAHLRARLVTSLRAHENKTESFPQRKHGVCPV